ncbi:MAG TPA: V-type ATPase subunit [Spirochaetota bacterium]|nr:V-type ATPase subunit [Spirochaetota bacterium]HOL56191.1 V-type ATPase subunit [Spirochaetota bacterium]HPP03795.1 V-type ATPase subunit [Spirochaetota bacterium]
MLGYEYVIAKIHGIHSKSIVGDNYKRLRKIDTIDKLAKELLGDDIDSNLTTKKMFTYIESKLKRKIYNQINDIVKYFDYKNELLNALILKYEIENVKIIINCHYSKEKNVKDLFEVKLKNSINYKLVYSMDLSDFKNITSIFVNTIFSFVLPLIESKKSRIYVENELDKFYYINLLNSLKGFTKEQKEKIKKVLIEEMNWHNILWALRTRFYYNKVFDDVKETFIKMNGLISLDLIKNIFSMEFVPNEVDKIFEKYPKSIKLLIKETTDENGEVNIPLLEEKVEERIANLYIGYFYIEFNILSIIAYVYIKMKEYNNIVKLVESLRYNLNLD